ncbi:MAG TPA: cation:proton antiporter [Acidimicrobiia bacterium]|nr:cation:proton antiporter [Acidimicrobiia bacterium]
MRSALAVSGILILVARPLAVAVSMLPFRLPWREQVVLSWVGLRGAVPIVLATFPASAGIPQGQTIFNVVFFVVLTSTLLQGTTTVSLVRRLGLEAPAPPWQSIVEALPLDLPEIDLAELTVGDDLAITSSSLRDLPPPRGVLVVAILRMGRTVLPSGETVIESGDTLLLSFDGDRVQFPDITARARGEDG